MGFDTTPPAANPTASLAHLQHLFGRCADELPGGARFEIRALWPDRARPTFSRTFPADADGFKHAAEHAASINSNGASVYVMVNPVRPDIGENQAANRADVIAAFFQFADCDDAAASAHASRLSALDHDAFSVTTGTIPEPRIHVYLERETPCLDLSEWTRLQKGIAAKLGSDSKVCDPPRLMRLAGTVAYPDAGKRKRGYVPELTTLSAGVGRRWSPDELSREFPAAALPDRAPVDQEPLVELDTEENVSLATAWLENEAPEAIEGAGGSDTTAKRIAPKLKDFGLSADMAVELALEHWNPVKAIPPWDPDDLERTIRSGYKSATLRQPGHLIASLPHHEFPPLPAEETARIEAGAKRATPAAESAKPAKKLRLLAWGDLREPDAEWLVDLILPRHGVAVMYGEPGSYKSFVAFYAAAAIASGRKFLGHRTHGAGQCVIYIAAEGSYGLKRRAGAIEQVHGIVDPHVKFVDHPLDLRSPRNQADALIECIAATAPDPTLIIIDTLARAFGGGDENSGADMSAFVEIVGRLRERAGAAILIVHHCGKHRAKGMRGHSSLLGAVDTEIEVQRKREAPKDGTGIGVGRLWISKQKDGPGGWGVNFVAEKVIFPPIQTDDDWDDRPERSSLAVREPRDGEAVGPSVSNLTTDMLELLSIIRKLSPHGGHIARREITDACRNAGWLQPDATGVIPDTEKKKLTYALHKKLVRGGYVEKAPSGEYAVTPLGMDEIGQGDGEDAEGGDD